MRLLKHNLPGVFLLLIFPMILVSVACGGAAGPALMDSEAPSSAPAVEPAAAPSQDSARTDAPKPSAVFVSDDPSALGNEGVIEGLLASESSQQVARQQRIIVRTVAMTLVVSDISSTFDTIGALAVQFGGWVVSSQRDQRHRSAISVRVPAERLDEALAQLRASALKVESEISSSQDFTDEYVDTRSRIKNLRVTEAQLLKLLERSDDIEDALKVQAEVTKVQDQIEKGQGRLNFLAETSAFSLINIQLKLGPSLMEVNAGPDPTVREGEPVRFRASITPPLGITDFTFEWEFGDDSSPVSGNRTALTVDNRTRTTATMTHIYPDDRDSPFIVTLKVTGIGDAGVAEGKDTLIVTVTKVPDIEVFADQVPTVRAGQPLELTGSFPRPADLTDFTYEWDFGDGSEPAVGSLPEGATNVSSTHIYPDARLFPIMATLTITANSDAGVITGSDSVGVVVVEGIPWLAGWDPSNTLKTAVLVLSYIGLALGSVAIWLAVFSPLWIIALVVIYIFRRRTGKYFWEAGEESGVISRTAGTAPEAPSSE